MTSNVYANSNWTFIVVDEVGDSLWIDKNSIQKSGDSITFWSRRNFKERDVNGNFSSKVQRTVNCRTRETIPRYYMFYDDINNMGNVTGNFAAINPKWIPIPPDTVLWGLYQFVCN